LRAIEELGGDFAVVFAVFEAPAADVVLRW
jgi:hypothetical protein